MSVDDTIRELSGTLSQLSQLVFRINEQIGGISGRINMTLQNFDDSIAGIAKDANKMTDQVDLTIAQIPGSWAFYLLFFTLIAVLVLLSLFIIINLIVKIQSLCAILRAQSSRSSTPLQSLVQSESKQPLHGPSIYSGPYHGREAEGGGGPRLRHHVAVEMESEPRRYGIGTVPQQSSSSQLVIPSRTTALTTTVYHPGGMSGIGGGGLSPSSELRGRSSHGSASPRSHQGVTTQQFTVHPMLNQHPTIQGWSSTSSLKSLHEESSKFSANSVHFSS